MLGIEKRLSMAFHPQTDRQIVYELRIGIVFEVLCGS